MWSPAGSIGPCRSGSELCVSPAALRLGGRGWGAKG